jgi:PST family polysaccharide transporter
MTAGGLRGQAVRGFLWSAISFGGNKLFVFVSTLVLTRLLDPANFGVVAAGLVAIAYYEVLLDLGLSSALVQQQKTGHGRSVNAAFTVNLGTCTILAVANFLAAPAMASFFHVPNATAVFQALSIYVLLRGVGAVQDALLNRDLRFREKAAADLTRAVVRGGIGVGLAFAGCGVWSLVIAFLVAEACGTTVAWSRTRYRPAIAYDWETVRPLLRFGAPVAALQLLAELGTNADYIVVGHRLGSTALGQYTIAFRLPELLLSNIFWIFSSVSFPVLSRARVEGIDAFRRAMLAFTRLVTLWGFPVSVGLALISRDAVHVLFGSQWDAAATPMMLISLALGFGCVGYASGDVFKAAGRPGTLLWINTIGTAIMVAGFIVAAPHGIDAVAAVHLSAQFVYAFVRIGVANRFMGTTAAEVLRAMWPSFAASAGIVLLALPPRLLIPQGPGAFVVIALAVLLGAPLGLAAAGRSALADVRRMMGEVKARKGGVPDAAPTDAALPADTADPLAAAPTTI